MLSITEAAGTHLVGLLDSSEAPDGAAARFVADAQGLSLKLDQPREGDEKVEHDGRTVLLMDDRVSQLLSNMTLDIEKTDEGQALTLR
jgi:Fe-S cluster assembly iron-binding protein IscA